jgi:hypothetical protein
LKGKIEKKLIKKATKKKDLSQLGLISQPWAQNYDNLIEKKKNHEDWFLINQILKDEIKNKSIFKKEIRKIPKSTHVNF